MFRYPVQKVPSCCPRELVNGMPPWLGGIRFTTKMLLRGKKRELFTLVKIKEMVNPSSARHLGSLPDTFGNVSGLSALMNRNVAQVTGAGKISRSYLGVKL
ncbi:hypothetical protein CDAR_602631 [Caerostris darwini]|uniref:Uncharacterized protein n=1 Tax=Caerostris darwini TaxID=1538125 RepID=A0AAV4QNE5_9ARAC|nr:hypothetical protein CDAR_602631 [Caerostris darwini]